ncbi:methyltransferase domain-containing protein [Neomicrococcus lactis]|uniref:SAM-dependent methyltransferase n=1 Tax=Neomicrococcus lactis TaxID=732241 RepID=A0A7W8YAQ4_9MICC|nr:SAM-dependent methyltransferase [Neomicrococcus lactis]
MEPTSRPAANIPPLPRTAPDIRATHRAEFGTSFGAGAGAYARIRPDYPGGVVLFLKNFLEDDDAARLPLSTPETLPATSRAALDVGAGTGIFSAQLAEAGFRVTAVDPSAEMLSEIPEAPAGAGENVVGERVVARGEELPFAAERFDLVTYAQAWHWVDPVQASAEAARVLTPNGALGLIWNQLDVTIPWVHRLSRIMHAGDVHRPDFRPEVGEQFGELTSYEERWEQAMTPESIIELAKTRSYYLRSSEAIRAKVEANLRWYLYENLAFAPGGEVGLPYHTHAWAARKC